MKKKGWVMFKLRQSSVRRSHFMEGLYDFVNPAILIAI